MRPPTKDRAAYWFKRYDRAWAERYETFGPKMVVTRREMRELRKFARPLRVGQPDVRPLFAGVDLFVKPFWFTRAWLKLRGRRWAPAHLLRAGRDSE